MKATDYRLTPNDIDAMTLPQAMLYFDEAEQPKERMTDEQIEAYVAERRRLAGINGKAE